MTLMDEPYQVPMTLEGRVKSLENAVATLYRTYHRPDKEQTCFRPEGEGGLPFSSAQQPGIDTWRQAQEIVSLKEALKRMANESDRWFKSAQNFGNTVDRLSGEILELKKALERATEERDRWAVLAQDRRMEIQRQTGVQQTLAQEVENLQAMVEKYENRHKEERGRRSELIRALGSVIDESTDAFTSRHGFERAKQIYAKYKDMLCPVCSGTGKHPNEITDEKGNPTRPDCPRCS